MAEVKKENWFKRTWGKTCKYFRELRSELKKVVWPNKKTVAKKAEEKTAKPEKKPSLPFWACVMLCRDRKYSSAPVSTQRSLPPSGRLSPIPGLSI